MLCSFDWTACKLEGQVRAAAETCSVPTKCQRYISTCANKTAFLSGPHHGLRSQLYDVNMDVQCAHGDDRRRRVDCCTTLPQIGVYCIVQGDRRTVELCSDRRCTYMDVCVFTVRTLRKISKTRRPYAIALRPPWQCIRVCNHYYGRACCLCDSHCEAHTSLTQGIQESFWRN
jgi:hypothetical protein